MAMVVEVQIQSSSSVQQQEIIDRVRDVVRNVGFSVDQSSYTPSEGTLSELGSVAAGRATVRVYES